jgi:superfamily II DNA or RNA helicase
MSCIIKRKDISTEDALLIKKLLTLTPKVSYNAKVNFGIKTNPLQFYFKNGEDVHIPMFFCKKFKNKLINDENKYREVHIKFVNDLFEHQVPVANEALQDLQEKRGTIVGLYPGFGKTVIGAYLSSNLNVLSCIVCHRDILQSQWLKTFTDFTDVKEEEIWIVGQSKVDEDKIKVIIVMDTRVKNIPLNILREIGLLIFDEAHCLCTQSRVAAILSFTPKYVVAMSATLERDDGMESMIYSVCGKKIISKLSTKPFDVYKYMTKIVPETEIGNNGQLNYGKMMSSLCLNEMRNKMIKDIVAKNPERKIMILTSLKEHINVLLKDFKELGEKVDFLAGVKKSYSDSRILLGTFSKIGTGFDEKNACADYNGIRIDMLILASSIKKHSLLEQNVGRVFRADFPTVYHLVDEHNIFKRHWSFVKKWYTSRNGKIIEC